MNDNTDKASYIIAFRESNEERRNALLFVISLLRKNFPKLEIIVVEQDDKSKIKFEPSLNVRHLFFENAKAFKHCHAYNKGAKTTDREILIFGCADVFLDRKDYEICFREIQNFEALTPNWTEIFNVKITDLQKHEFTNLNFRELYTYAGGILFMTRSSFEKSGGWDERFEGWGCEDDAMSHVIFNKLSSISLRLPMYHIDHPRGADRNHQEFIGNQHRLQEIRSFHGPVLDRYVEFLQIENGFKEGTPLSKKGKPKFVFAITTFNRYDYLKNCIESFFRTRTSDADWQIIVADDGSTDETSEYIEMLEKNHGAIVIRNRGTGNHRQVNTIFRKLEELDFDLCFKSKDELIFQQKGWDDLYWETVQRTGYDHLIFFEEKRKFQKNLKQLKRVGGLVSTSVLEKGCDSFFTLTKRVLKEVGYYDEQLFRRNGLAEVDFSSRCCRVGFNVFANPFDVKGSNDFLQVQEAYSPTADSENVPEFKKSFIQMERRYIPFNQNYFESTLIPPKSEKTPQVIKKVPAISRLRRADSKFYPERGIGGFIGFLVKRLYNFGIDTRLYFIPKRIKKIGKNLNKLGEDLMTLEE